MSDKKNKILIICDYYLPGYQSGGGLRTIVNTVERLKNRFDFFIITRDNDGDGIIYTTVKIDEWNNTENAQVYYLSQKNLKISKLRELIYEVKPHSIYINSVFSRLSIYVLILNKLKALTHFNIILAPEGELSPGALQVKSPKKKSFLNFSKTVGLFKNIIWKTTSELEKREVEKIKGSGGEIFIAPNMPPQHFYEEYRQEQKPAKFPGEAKMVFLSRYMKKKNFKWLLEHLSGIRGNLVIDIYGPLEDEAYWRESLAIIKTYPDNIKVEYKGVVYNEEVVSTLFNYHFFLLPTLGENFGHVFLEAAAAGCPLIISDRTPWLNLEEKQIGWDLPLEKPEEWNKIINYCLALDGLSYAKMSGNARRFSDRWLADSKVIEDNAEVLEFSLNKPQAKAQNSSK